MTIGLFKEFSWSRLCNDKLLDEFIVATTHSLPTKVYDYAKEWFLKHERIESDRFAAWACYCILKSGYPSVAKQRAAEVLVVETQTEVGQMNFSDPFLAAMHWC